MADASASSSSSGRNTSMLIEISSNSSDSNQSMESDDIPWGLDLDPSMDGTCIPTPKFELLRMLQQHLSGKGHGEDRVKKLSKLPCPGLQFLRCKADVEGTHYGWMRCRYGKGGKKYGRFQPIVSLDREWLENFIDGLIDEHDRLTCHYEKDSDDPVGPVGFRSKPKQIYIYVRTEDRGRRQFTYQLGADEDVETTKLDFRDTLLKSVSLKHEDLLKASSAFKSRHAPSRHRGARGNLRGGRGSIHGKRKVQVS